MDGARLGQYYLILARTRNPLSFDSVISNFRGLSHVNISQTNFCRMLVFPDILMGGFGKQELSRQISWEKSLFLEGWIHIAHRCVLRVMK